MWQTSIGEQKMINVFSCNSSGHLPAQITSLQLASMKAANLISIYWKSLLLWAPLIQTRKRSGFLAHLNRTWVKMRITGPLCLRIHKPRLSNWILLLSVRCENLNYCRQKVAHRTKKSLFLSHKLVFKKEIFRNKWGSYKRVQTISNAKTGIPRNCSQQ